MIRVYIRGSENSYEFVTGVGANWPVREVVEVFNKDKVVIAAFPTEVVECIEDVADD